MWLIKILGYILECIKLISHFFNFQVGDEIAIASTSFVPDQAEKRKITKVDGHILTLDQALEFDHDYLLQTV